MEASHRLPVMKRSDKAARIQAILEERCPNPPIPLDHRDPFTLLIAVLLSAQCTDERVNRTTPGLFARAATPQAMQRVPVREVCALIRSCGLAPQKAKAIVATSALLVERHAGKVPPDLAALEALPGVGHKTASVVLAQAFGVPTFPVDTHIHRLAWRWGLSNGSSVERTERDLVRTFPRDRWIALHLQIIHFGRGSCPAVGHNPKTCAICSWAMSETRRHKERMRRRGSRGPQRFGKRSVKSPTMDQK